MNDAFYRLLEELSRNAVPLGGSGKRGSKRAPREFPPVGMVPVRDSGDSIVRDTFGAPVKALGRVREETYVVPGAQSRGIDMGDGSAAYRRDPASNVEVRPFTPDALPQGEPLQGMIGPDSTPAAGSNYPAFDAWQRTYDGAPDRMGSWDTPKPRIDFGRIDVVGRGDPSNIEQAAIDRALEEYARRMGSGVQLSEDDLMAISKLRQQKMLKDLGLLN